MPVPISNVTRRVVYAASGTGPYAFTFEILANTDIAVYKDDALLTLTTDYTVTIAGNGTGSITLVASPTGATQIAIVGNRTIQRTTDFVTGGDFFANTVNDEMDQQTIFAQQNAEGLQRALSAPQTDPTSINMTLPRAALRANKALGFDANGNPAIADTLGTNRGNWASGTLYYVRDIIKDTTNSNIWQCIVQHTSSGSQPIGTNADVAKWSLLVDAAAAATSATNAAASASAASSSASAASTSASNASSSASTASTQASNASTSATNAASSASAASSSASTASTAATNAGNSATAAATSATNASNSASAASTSASNASSSASAASTSASNASTSASNAASSASAASGSASTATTQATNAASSATAAAASETAAAASATSAAASYDAFDDRYLGAKSSNPTLDNDGNALLTGAIYFNTVATEMRVYTGSAWQAQAASPDTIAERSFSATAGQTSYTFTGGYRVGYTYVYINGALLAAADITATDGTTITFGTALSLNDEVRILSYKAIGSVAIGDISGLQTALDAKVAGAAATTTVGGDLKLYEGTNNGTNYTGFQAPASLAANVTYTLPSADGTNGQALITNGSGVLSFSTVTSPPGGSNTQIQYNNGGAFAGSANFTFDGTNAQLGATGALRFADTDLSNYVAFKAAGTIASNVTWTLPSADGTNGQVLSTNGSGALSWASAPAPSAFSDGSAGAPSITFASDTDTGIYRAGTNQIASSAGGVGWLTSRYTLGNIPASDNGVTNYAQQFMAMGMNPSVLDQSGSAALLNIDTEDNSHLITRVPYAVKITGGGRPDNTSYNAPAENGLLALIPQTWGGNNVVGRNTLYVKNNYPYFVTKSTGIYVLSTHYASGIGIDSLVKADDPNGGGQPVAISARVDNSNTIYDNSAPICLLMDNGPSDNISKTNGGQSLGISYDRRNGSTSRPTWQFYRNTTGNLVGSISTTNTATTYSTSSDYRLKNTIAPMTGALAKVALLKPCTYKWNADGSDGQGFIAHELAEVVPQCVTGEKDGVETYFDEDGNKQTRPKYQGIDTSFLVATLTAAIQELKAEFDAYKATHP